MLLFYDKNMSSVGMEHLSWYTKINGGIGSLNQFLGIHITLMESTPTSSAN